MWIGGWNDDVIRRTNVLINSISRASFLHLSDIIPTLLCFLLYYILFYSIN